MAFLKTNNVEVKGLAACVPKRVVKNRDYTLMTEDDLEKYIATTGVEQRRSVVHDGTVCASDLCYESAEKIIAELNWDKNEIDLLVFVSQTRDYLLPQTSCILQDRLGLSKNTLTFDIPAGCPGYITGLGVVSSLLSSGMFKKALLLVGNTQSYFASYEDRSMYLLLGDAGSATGLEYSAKPSEMLFHFHTDGSKKDILIVPEGGSRKPVSIKSFEMKEFEDGIKRSGLHESMDGTEVFSYALNNAPKSILSLKDKFGFSLEDIDLFLFHQANLFLCEKLRKKLKIEKEKVPYNLRYFGNTSGTSIPLLMVTNLSKQLESKKLNLVLNAFGVGFTIGSAKIQTDQIKCPELLTL